MAAKAKAAASDADLDDVGDAKAAGKKKRKLPSKIVLIVAAALVVCGGGGGAAYYFLRGDHSEDKPKAPPPKPVTFLDMPDVLVNLANGSSDRTQYLKIKIVLELPDQAFAEAIKPLMPRVMDAFQTYLRELRPTDLDGSAGLYRLREELTRRVNAAVAPSRVNAVLFKEIVIQ